MAAPRRFDHDEARRLRADGVPVAEIARRFNVTTVAIYLALQTPQQREHTREYSREYQREHLRRPCIEGCGRLAWHGTGRTGRCRVCTGLLARTALHGSETRYLSGCRCDECRLAMNAARNARRKNNPDIQQHGRASSYKNGCRCRPCRTAYAAWWRDYRRRRAERAAAA